MTNPNVLVKSSYGGGTVAVIEEDLEIDLEAGLNGETRQNSRKSKEKSLVSMAGKVVGKMRGDYKTIDCFTFKSNTKTGSLKARALFSHAKDCHEAVVQLKETINELLEEVSKTNQTKLKVADNLIAVGTKMKGEISIPPQSFTEETEGNDDQQLSNIHPDLDTLQQDTFRPYQLSILRELVDEVGNTIWIGRHQTYEGRRDKQTVLIHYANNTEGFIHFEDYETHCDGEITEGNNKLIGTVKQLKKGRPGFFVPNRGVEHNFMLQRTEDSQFEKSKRFIFF